MSIPVFTGPTAWRDGLEAGLKAAAADAKDAAEQRRTMNTQLDQSGKTYDMRGPGAVDAWHELVSDRPAPVQEANDAARAAAERRSFESWGDAMDAGALDMPAWAPPPSGPEEITERFESFKKSRAQKAAGDE